MAARILFLVSEALSRNKIVRGGSQGNKKGGQKQQRTSSTVKASTSRHCRYDRVSSKLWNCRVGLSLALGSEMDETRTRGETEGLGDEGKGGLWRSGKKENEEGRLRKHPPRGWRQTRNPLRRRHRLEFKLQTSTNTRGESVEGKDGPQVWVGEQIPPFFRSRSHHKVFQNSICWYVYGVGWECKN